MLMETVKLSRIVMKLTPDMYPCLKSSELDIEIVLKNGLESLEAEDALDIVKYSISEYSKDALLH
ncbi:hypothetical protein FE784_13860 [Paenibacillus hemerocallicola]|uniref:Uncharacterized protein n=2 Tax=Paenibacillus hemerocallicola TaxID=1172614 RepID=A0A5C4T9Y9_9BACL|nr:hypothetical protein [Paenibacillus hemerocallicola]TNJ65732.1 hypothetical protein FE784_13860 [Paenibacillus hemerocallicola]